MGFNDKDWEEFKSAPNLRLPEEIRVSLNHKSIFAFNRYAFDALGEAEAVVLLLDKINSLIGFRPAHPRLDNAFPLKCKNKYGSYIIRANLFCIHHGIKPDKTIVFRDVRTEDNRILVLNLLDTFEIVPRASSN